MLKKVLIVDNRDDWQRRWSEALKEEAEVISAFSVAEAEEKFYTNPGIKAIVVCTCGFNDDEMPITIPLIERFRETFDGPMIGTSCELLDRASFKREGCNHVATRFSMPYKLLSILAKI